MSSPTSSQPAPPAPGASGDPTRRTAGIRIPFPARLNQHAERARRHTLQWAQGMGLLTGEAATAEYDALRLERLMAYFYPDAGAAALEVATDFNAWFFIFDDQFDGGLGSRPEPVRRMAADLAAALSPDPAPTSPAADPAGPAAVPVADRADHAGPAAAPRTGEVPRAPLVRAFRDIWLRSADGAPEHWRRRFRRHWRGYLAAHEAEAQHRTAARLPALADFLDVRRETIGVRPCLDYTERCGGYTLPDELYGSAALREMREITGEVVIYVNDIVSLGKELAAGDVNNSVVVHRAHKGCTLDESVAHVAGLANARTARFTRLAGALPVALADHGVPERLRGHVAHYVDGMRHLMAGNLAWSLATARYDAAGVAAVSGGRARPWSGLAAPDPAPRSRRLLAG